MTRILRNNLVNLQRGNLIAVRQHVTRCGAQQDAVFEPNDFRFRTSLQFSLKDKDPMIYC